MVFQIVIFAAALAYANAGYLGAPAVATYSAAPAVSSAYISHAAPVVAHAPVAVAHAAPVAVAHAAPVAIHAPAVGASHQSVVRSFGGNQAISTYSKAVDTAFSSVRKYDTRITNDAIPIAHAPVHYAAPAVATYAAHATPVAATYTAHAPLAVAHAAPVATYAAPVATYAAHAPVVKTAALGVAYSPAAVVSHTAFDGFGAHYAF